MSPVFKHPTTKRESTEPTNRQLPYSRTYGGVVFASLQIGLGIKRSDSEQPAYAVGSGHGGANVYATIQ